MSALPPKAHMCGALAHVRVVPKADIVLRSRRAPPVENRGLKVKDPTVLLALPN